MKKKCEQCGHEIKKGLEIGPWFRTQGLTSLEKIADHIIKLRDKTEGAQLATLDNMPTGEREAYVYCTNLLLEEIKNLQHRIDIKQGADYVEGASETLKTLVGPICQRLTAIEEKVGADDF